MFHICKKKNSSCLIDLLRHMLEEPINPWEKSWMNIQKDVGVITSYERKYERVSEYNG